LTALTESTESAKNWCGSIAIDNSIEFGVYPKHLIIIIMIIMTFIPRILASASNALKQSHCQTGKS